MDILIAFKRKIEKGLNVRGYPVLDEFGLGPFGCLAASALSADVGAFDPAPGSLEGLAKVGEANANTRHQHFIPTLKFFPTWRGFNFKHNLEKALQMPQKFYPKKKKEEGIKEELIFLKKFSSHLEPKLFNFPDQEK